MESNNESGSYLQYHLYCILAFSTWKYSVLLFTNSFIKKGRNYTFKSALYAKDKSTDVANNHIKWKSSNKRIASVDADTGVVKARKPGKFFIIACWSGNTDKKVYTRITVVK